MLGSPNSTASAGVPLIWLRYQAQMMGEPVESVSGGFMAENEGGHGSLPRI